jgi:formylglycine-generating enzyme required for sulfatase activity
MDLQNILQALVREFGPEVLKERNRALGLVADRHPAAQREQRLLRRVYEAGIVEDLRRDGGEHAQRRALQRLTWDYLTEPGLAAVAVEALCVALGHRFAGWAAPVANAAPSPSAVPGPSPAAPNPASLPKVENIHGWPAAKVQELQRQAAAALGKPVVFRDRLQSGGEGPEMAVIPAGAFLMGSPVGEPERSDDEGPQHLVTVAQPFAIGRYAVTFEEYDRYCVARGEIKPDDKGWGRGRRPVVNVNWDDAQAFCAWLSSETGQRYRLPSEAEWEYACRAGTTTPFWWGKAITPQQANYDGDYVYNGGSKGVYLKGTVPAEKFSPNPFGLYQMHGNVWEWCADQWHGSYRGAPTDSRAWVDKSNAGHRAVRGGAWYNKPGYVRSASRDWYGPSDRGSYLGFRLAQD